MFFCKHCGYSCHNEGVNCCNNIKCRYYCQRQKPDGDFGKNCDQSNGKRGGDCHSRRESRCPDENQMPHDCCCGLKNQEKSKCEKRLISRGGHYEDGYQPEIEKKYDKDCGCKTSPAGRDCFGMPDTQSQMLGLATVPFQHYGSTYDKKQGLISGTIFPDLDMPYNKRIIRRG